MAPRRLAAVPDAPRRAIAYVRVSKERDDMVSPEIQRAAIEDYCARNGIVIVDVLEDLDRTGRFWQRRKIEQAVTAIEQGQADVIVVWRTSRVARNRKDFWIGADRVESVGGQILSATEPLDVTTPSGRLTRGMLVELAVYESEQIGAAWRETHANRVRRGLPYTTHARLGYVHTEGHYEPDPKTAPVLAELYRRYAAGDSYYALTKWLNETGVTPPPIRAKRQETTWSSVRVRRILDAGFGAGKLNVAGELVDGAHDAVITETEWAAYLAARDQRRRPAARAREHSPYLLSGLIRCKLCDVGMHAGTHGRRSLPYYRCTRHSEHPGGTDHGPGRRPWVRVAVADAAVLDWLRGVAADVDAAAKESLVDDTRLQLRRLDADALARQILQVDQQLTRLAVGWAEQVIPEHTFVAARDELADRRARLEESHRQAVADLEAPLPAVTAADLLADWDTLAVNHRRRILGTLIESVLAVGITAHVVDLEVRPRKEARSG